MNKGSNKNDENNERHQYNGKHQKRKKSVTVTVAAFREEMLTVWEVGLRTQLFRHGKGPDTRAVRAHYI